MTFHHFYPRSPCGERPGKVKVVEPGFTFLSTLSLRRATGNLVGLVRRNAHFYPRSPCGERLHHRTRRQSPSHFYPRSPCGERLLDAVQIVIIVIFLSTLSLRRATAPSQRHESKNRNFYPRSPCGERPTHCLDGWKSSGISIHALLAESDDAVESIPH